MKVKANVRAGKIAFNHNQRISNDRSATPVDKIRSSNYDHR